MPTSNHMATPPSGSGTPRMPRPLVAIHAAAALGLLVVVLIAATLVWQGRTKALRDAQQELDRVVTGTENDLNRSLVGLDALLAEVATWTTATTTSGQGQPQPFAPNLNKLLGAVVNTNLLLRNVVVLDGPHRVMASARPDTQRLGLGVEPDFIEAVLAQPYPSLMVSAPIQTDLSPERMLYLARSAPRQAGGPLVVLAEIRLAPLSIQLDPGDPANGLSVTLEKASGILLAAFPPTDRGSNVPLHPTLPMVHGSTAPDNPADTLALTTTARLSGEPAWLATRQLLYPELWVSVSETQAHALAAWRTDAQVVAAVALALCALMGGLWLGSVRHLQRMAAANARISEANGQLAAGNQAMMRSLSLVEATLDATADAVVVIDQHLRVVRFNARYLQVLGLSEAQLANQNAPWLRERLNALLHNTDDVDEVAHNAYKTPEIETRDELRFKDGRVFMRHSIPQRLNGLTVGRVWSYQDITAFRQSERHLREREAVLEQTRADLSATLEAIPDLLFEMDEHGTYLSVHAHTTSLLVVEPGLFLGKQVSDVLTGATADTTMACLREAAATGVSYGKQIQLNMPTGPMWFELSAARKTTVAGMPRRIVVLSRNITDRKHSEDLIWQQAHLDLLTGLPNRRLFREHLDKTLAIAHQHEPRTPVGLLFVDLDRFKVINDTHGHDVGDLLLQQAAQRLQHCVRPTDLVARLGGDEFTLVVQGVNAPERMADIAHQVVARLSEAFVLGEETEYISASVGMTLFPDDALDSDTLVRQADQAMYAAKQAGRNRCERFSPRLQEAAMARSRIARDLRFALDGGQMALAYQPIVDLRTGQARKAEALLRWTHPQHGPIGPAVFIPVAEEYGLIEELGEWVFEQAALQLKQWRQSLHPDFQVSVNKSPVQFRAATSACRNWGEHLAAMGLPGSSMVVEITEGLLMEATDTARAHLKRLHDSGLQLALDDFGTGYSALSYLHQFDLDLLKIDRAFVRNLGDSGKDLALCKATIAMAHALGLKVVAEGIETAEQAQLLTDAGCDFGQGYWFSPPLPADGMAQWVWARNA